MPGRSLDAVTDDATDQIPLLPVLPKDDIQGLVQQSDPSLPFDVNERPRAYYLSFLLYSAALEAVQLTVLSLYLPLMLEQYARENGRLDDHTTPCDKQEDCQVHLAGMWVNTSSFSLFVSTASVALQALVAMSIGDFVDAVPNRRRVLLLACIAPGIAVMLFYFIASSSVLWPLVALLAIIVQVSHSITTIAQNASVPIIARHRSRQQRAMEDGEVTSREMAQVSSKGIFVGYVYGIVFLGLCQIPARYVGGLAGMRTAVALAGLQLLLFVGGISAYEKNKRFPDEEWRKLNVKSAWKQLWGLVKEASALKETAKYLLWWMFESDGLATISSTAILYAKTAIQMSPSQIIGVGVLVPVCSTISTVVWPIFAKRYLLSSHRMLVLLTSLTSLIPLYAHLGFIPAIRNAGGFGSFTTPAEMYVVAALYGSMHGAFNAYSRSTYAELLPERREGQFFALYSITSKSSAFLGPLLVGILSQSTGSLRSGFVVILIGCLGPLPLLMSININKGRQDARAFAAAQVK